MGDVCFCSMLLAESNILMDDDLGGEIEIEVDDELETNDEDESSTSVTLESL